MSYNIHFMPQRNLIQKPLCMAAILLSVQCDQLLSMTEQMCSMLSLCLDSIDISIGMSIETWNYGQILIALS